MSNIVGRMKVSFNKFKINNRARGVFKDNGSLNQSFSRLGLRWKFLKKGWGGSRRYLCGEVRLSTMLSDMVKTGNKIFSTLECTHRKESTEISIATRGLNNTISFYLSSQNLVEKIVSLNNYSNNMFYNLTKVFLTDIQFLKFVYFIMKNKGDIEELGGINDL